MRIQQAVWQGVPPAAGLPCLGRGGRAPVRADGSRANAGSAASTEVGAPAIARAVAAQPPRIAQFSPVTSALGLRDIPPGACTGAARSDSGSTTALRVACMRGADETKAETGFCYCCRNPRHTSGLARRCLSATLSLATALLVSCLPSAFPEINEPLVVFTFDDAHHSIYEIAFPLMRSYDRSWAATHFFPVTYPGSPGLVTLDQLREMEAAGWESGGHGRTHANLSAVTPEQVQAEVTASDSFLRANGLSHESYAYAYGNYNDSVQAVVARYFRNIRTSHDFKYLDGVNRLQLGAYDAKAGHTADDLIGRVEEARMMGAPLVVFCFHVIVPDTVQPDVTHEWWVRQSAFTGLLDYLRERGMAVLTIKEAMRKLCP